MHIYKKRLDIETHVAAVLKNNKTIGFVPTMGALHKGHLSLIQQSIDENDTTIVSIFINPTQFNNTEDLTNYPKNLTEDVALLETLSQEVVVFAPSATEIYGKHTEAINYNFGGIENEMEGKYRTGHFDGVGTVLKHLFTIVKPTRAYFGEKDFQQLQIVRKLVDIEKMSVQIIGCPIFREEKGLALSSRNKRLNKEQIEAAPIIYETLNRVKEDFGTKSVTIIKEWVSEEFDNQELLELEYFEIAKVSDLKSIKRKHKTTKYRAFIAVYAGEVRLIDNIALN